MKRKLLFAALCVVSALGFKANAQASFNHAYTVGVEPAAGGDYFLYNIESGQFLTNGFNWGTHAAADNSGRVLTLSANGTGYNIYTEHYSLNDVSGEPKSGYLTTNSYVDSGSSDAAWVFTPDAVAGYTNAYKIKNSDTQYLIYNASDSYVNVGEDNGSHWLLIPKSVREAAGDYTHYLINTQMNTPWERKAWSGSLANNNDVIAVGGLTTNRCGEKFHVTKDIYQTLSQSLPAGRYRFSAQAFWRQDGSDAGAVLYMGDASTTLATFNGKGEGTAANMDGASTSFNAGLYVNSVEKFLNSAQTGVKLGINISSDSQWVIFDNFVLDYLGQCVMDYAVALPDGGAMTADTWYYFDIAVAGDNYNATASDLSAIICTTDGYTLTSATSGDITLTAENNDLSVTRYYVKSVGKSNSLAVAPASYTYTVGSPTLSVADGAYTNNSLSTFTFNFSEASTNDPGASFALLNGSAKASLKKGGVLQAEGTLSLDGKVLTATFSDLTLDLSSTYTIDLDADVVGYAGHETNAAVNTTLKTGIITNGVYYFKKKGEYKYLTRGGYYGTETVVDNYGLSFEAQIQADGKYFMKNVDHSLAANTNKYLNAYTDQDAYGWTIAAATGGYYLKDGDGKYLTTTANSYTDVNGNKNTYYYQSRTSVEGDAIIWELLSKAEYATSLAAKKNAEIVALATAAGIGGITTLAELESTLASDYGTTEMTSEISNPLCSSADDWTAVSYNGGSKYEAIDYHAPTIQIWNTVGGITQTISSLPEGLYKITVSATWRPGNSTDATRVGNEANTTAWIYANDNITQLKGWYEGGGTINSTQDLVDNAASYLNTVYAYVDGTEDLKIGVAVPSFCQQNWCPIYNWTLTYYEAKATPAEKAALAAAITAAEAKTLGFEDNEYAPYNNVDALTKLATAKAINPETASGAAVVAATTALTSATWTKNVGEKEAIYNPTFALSDNDGAMAGWITDNAAGLGGAYHARAFVLTSGMDNYDNLAAFGQGEDTRSCAYFRFDGTNSSKTTTYTYGATTGYTIPLKEKVYELKAQVGGWGQVDKDIKLSVVNSSDVVVATQTVHTPNPGVNAGGPVVDFDIVFDIKTAGDYKILLQNGNTGVDQAVVVSNFSLLSAPAQSVTITAAGYATYSNANYALDLANLPDGLTAYYVAGDGVKSTYISLTTADEAVPANTGLLFQGEANTTYYVPVAASGTALTGNRLFATDGNDVAAGNYVFAFVTANPSTTAGFYALESATAVAAGKAYLNTGVLAAKTLRIGGTATEIVAPEVAETEEEEVLFNMAGVQVDKNFKGFVVNQKGEKRFNK